MRKIKVAITHGDVNGVSYEIILKTFAMEEMFSICTPVVFGSPKVAAFYKKLLPNTPNFNVISKPEQARDNQLNIIDCFPDEEIKIEMGRPSKEVGKAAFKALERATDALKNGTVDVLVTAPINKNTIQNEQFNFPGHTEYIENKLGQGKHALMILMNEKIKVALVTTHLPVAQIASHITTQAVERKLAILNEALKRDFAIDNPRIAVLSLNPHCGDNGLLGKEEIEIINPAIKNAFEKGVKCFGPYPADGFFGTSGYEKFDAVLAMYHDQGLAPFKAIAMDDGVNFTAGLPVVRTSPDHGTAYDIAGKNIASENSFRHAIYTAVDVFRNRLNFDEAYKNPLKKQYYDKKDDSDKLKLDQITEEDML